MGLREVMQPTNINFAAWREQYAREAASDLVLNAITPSLPLDNQWSYIEDAGADLYENEAMEEKFDRGGAATESVSHLRKARGVLVDKTAEIANAATLGFDAHIRSSIEYAQSFLMMSKITMCATMEHTGFSLASLPRYYARGTLTQPHFVKLLQELPHFAKCAFDLLYAAHCLHTKAGIVQGDLHGNNATLYVFADNYKQQKSEDGKIEFKEVVHNAVVMYVAGPRGEADSYVFPYTGLVGVVIDFSRSIFGPGMRAKLEEDFGKDFARNFYRDQISRAMRVLNRYAPTFVPDHQEALKAAFLRDPEAAFRVLSFVDFLAVGAALAAMLKSYPEKDVLPTDHRNFEPSPHIIAFAERIEKLAREELIVRLHQLAGPRAQVGGAPQAKGRTKLESIPYAGEVLLEKLFSDYKFSAKAVRGATLCDAYNHNNPMKWSGRSYEKFPPWARLDEIEKRLGNTKLADLIGRGPEAFVAALEPETRTEIIAETMRAEQSALDLPTLAATSSWID
jgi:hypothetical protein